MTYRFSRSRGVSQANHVVPRGYEQVHKDLMSYNGTFNLLLNLRSAIIRYGKLTDKQWAAAEKCLKPKIQDPTTILVDNCNIPIVVSTSAARYIAKKHGWPMSPRTLIVTQIKSKRHNKYELRVKMDWSTNVTECRCCGRALTDWRSQATGVGPTCVKRTSIAYVRNKSDVARFQKEMMDLCASMGEVDAFVGKWYIQHGLPEIENMVASSTPVKKEVVVSNDLVFPLQYCDWDEAGRKLKLKRHLIGDAVTNVTEALAIHNSVTNNTVKFVKQLVWGAKFIEYVSVDLDRPITLQII